MVACSQVIGSIEFAGLSDPPPAELKIYSLKLHPDKSVVRVHRSRVQRLGLESFQGVKNV